MADSDEQLDNYNNVDSSEISSDRESLTLEGVHKFRITLDRQQDKLDTLVDLYEICGSAYHRVLVFCRTRRSLEVIRDRLTEENLPVSCACEEMEEHERDEALRNFSSRSSIFLIITDQLASHIDVSQFCFVVNFDLPAHSERYIHRIGRRSSRFAPKRVAIHLITPHELEKLRFIESVYDISIMEMPENICDYAPPDC